MKIGYIVPEFPGQTHGFFWREIKHLEKIGAEITILSTRRPRGETIHIFSKEAAQRTHYLAEIKASQIFTLIKALFLAPVLLMRRDVRELISQEQEGVGKIFMLACLGIVLRDLCKARGIGHIHGHSCADVAYILAFCRLSGGVTYSLSLHGELEFYGRGHAFKFTHAKLIACVTQDLCDRVSARIRALSKAPKLVRMGIEHEPDIVKAPTQWSPKGTLRLATVARLDAGKGHHLAIKAAGDLIKSGLKIEYDIIGEGDHLSAINAAIADAGLEDSVHLLGSLPNDQIKKKLCEYDAFILPSYGEAAPVAIMEAMSVGIPAVCSIVGGVPEMIEHEKTGFLFPSGDADALTAILTTLAGDPALRAQVGAVGKQHAESHFLTSVSARILLDAISDND
jgi:colanic acid/amylovoran biosynthesis glycosyltransferase